MLVTVRVACLVANALLVGGGATLGLSWAAVTADVCAAQGPTPDIGKLGPQVGQRAPDFSLPDQEGRTRTRASLSGPNGLVLVFSRSADW